MKNIYLKYVHNFASSGYAFDRALIQELVRVRGLKGNNIRVLDFGCGMKPFAYLFENVAEYVGIDVYPGKVVDVVYDGSVIPAPDGYYDLVFSSSVLEHVENIEFSLGEIARILKPAGILVSVVPFVNHAHGTPYDFHRPTRFGWKSMLSRKFGCVYVKAVDNRWQCVLNLIASAVNNSIYDVLRAARNWLLNIGNVDIEAGGASPESKQNLSLLYSLMKLNPVNFCLGLLWVAFSVFGNGGPEGEITSGYLIVASRCGEHNAIE